ncbi:alanine--tRNA ligase [Peptostreptococcaceae bacterium AGR-M142]
MQSRSLNELRDLFLDFFESKKHLKHESFPLVPQNDKSLLLINAGMAPLKPYFMGKEEPPSKRMTTCQKCIRTGDIENVGITARHATFFEMLGNFSFGDYFKRESIAWGYEFVTEVLNMPIDKVWVSVYENDDESYDIWTKEIGIREDRMVRLGKEDNFWEIGTGPCGPCSELYYDRGEKYSCGSPDCKPGCECDRYVEFWNHVFTQYDKDEEGNYNPLPKPNIDTGMGLERLACIMQGVDTIFEIDTIKYILDGVLKISNKEYGKNDKEDISIRIITDHIRAGVFLISDGVLPSNEGRGYVLRRLLRRALRHGKLLGIKGDFLAELSNLVFEINKDSYKELVERKDYIKKILRLEEERFQETIDQGIEILNNAIKDLKENNKKVLDGSDAFKLYDTYGFPVDLTKEILEEESLTLDEEEFNNQMEEQRNRARNARKGMEGEGWKEDVFASLDKSIKSEFVGYNNYYSSSNILAMAKDNEITNEISMGDKAFVVLDKSPFYPEGGGQIGDQGLLINDDNKAKVLDTKKGTNDKIVLTVEVIRGSFKLNSEVRAFVDENRRRACMKNHSATHLLHKALQEVLGTHVKQSGSLVNNNRLRFDFTHFEAITKDELKKVEKLVNEQISNSLEVVKNTMSMDEAKKIGATALFGEKYSNEVRVVMMGDYSVELCGGTHINNTSEIGMFKIVSESGIASGVRRIEAITGLNIYEYINEKEDLLNEVMTLLKTKEDVLINRVENLLKENKDLTKELTSLKNELASSSLDDILNKKEEIEGVYFISEVLNNMDMDSLRNLCDKLKDKVSNSVIVLANVSNDKVNFIVSVTKDALSKNVHAGNMIREIAKVAGGGGGGRPDMAQAGGKDASKVKEAINKGKEVLKAQIKG